MDIAEDRNRFSVLLEKDGIPSPANGSAYSEKEAYDIAAKIGYPVLVRPSYVLGGRAMELVHDELQLQTYIKEAVRVSNTHPVLIDRYLDNATELDVDAVCDGESVLIGGVMEHIEEAGVHSGDSACVLPTQTLTPEQVEQVKEYTRKIALSLNVIGLINIQYALHDGTIYVLEANPRASRTVPFVSNATELDVDAVCDGEQVLIGGVMEHIEEAGVHSGDSACVLPTQTLTPEQIELVKEYTRKIALSLNVIGLINIQYALHDGTIYVLEANPRASRTVPFVSKATGLPLAKIAAKVMLGKKLSELGYQEKEIKHVAVKEVLLPFSKLPGVDPILGPEMKSTGEVIGIDYDFGRAFYKASQAADNTLPLAGNVFISVTDSQKPEILPIAKKLHELGFTLYGTVGTVRYMESHGVPMSLVRKVQEGSPNIIDMIRGADVDLVINTPGDKNARQDHFQMMRATIDYSIPYVTTIFGAEAAALAIESMKNNKITIEPLSHYHSA